MCFSAEASIISGAFLSVAGYATVTKARRVNPNMTLFALFPVIFALHQFVEAGVWLTLGDNIKGTYLRYIYISIAFLVWPVLAPSAIMKSETSPSIKKFCQWLTVGGFLFMIYLAQRLFFSPGIDAIVFGHSLHYEILGPKPPYFVEYVYAIFTLVPFLISRSWVIKFFGVMVGVTFGVTYTLLHSVYFSTWCMASALLSAMIYFAIKPLPQSNS